MAPSRFFPLWLLVAMVARYEAASETLSLPTKNVHLRGNHVVERRQESSWRRLPAPTLTTTRCNVIRLEDYQAELQLVYSYLVEFATGSSRSLSGVETAITHAVAQELDDCDIIDRPLYKVKTNTRHAFSKERSCAPILGEGNTCQVVTGVTAILLDSDSAHAMYKTYHAIKVGLNNTNFIDQFAPTVVRSEFLDEIRESLVLSPDSEDSTGPGSITASVAIAAASVSFVVASIFCYGIMRRDNRNSSEPHIRHKNRAYHRSALTIQNPMGIQKHRRHFVRLDGLNESPIFHSPATFVTTSYSSPRDYAPSITWSVSDITSDSCSIYSSLSKTTSMLERIEEEVEVEESFDEDDEDYDEENSENYVPRDFENMTVPSFLYGRPSSRRIHIENFDGAVFNEQAALELSELEGCRYLDDSPGDGYGEICHVVTPLDMEDEMDDAVFIPNLQVIGGDAALIPDHDEGYEEGENSVPVEEVHEFIPYMTISAMEDDLEFSAEEDSIEDDLEDFEGYNSIDAGPRFSGEEDPAQADHQSDESSLHTLTDSETSCSFTSVVVEAKRDLQDGKTTQADADTSTLEVRDPKGEQPPATESESKPNQDTQTEICNDPIESGPQDPQVAVLAEPESSETHPKTAAPETPQKRDKSQDDGQHGLQDDTSIEDYGTPLQEAPSPSTADAEEQVDATVVDPQAAVLEEPESSETHPKTTAAPETPPRLEKSQDFGQHGLQDDTSIENYGTPLQEPPSPPSADDAEEEQVVDTSTVVADSSAQDDNLKEWVAYLLDGLVETATIY